MSDRGETPYIVVEKGGSGFGSFLLGALLGAGAALLLAPRTGEETQKELREQAIKWKGIAEDRVKDAQQRIGEGVEEVRDGLQSKLEDVREAVDSGRRAASDAREDLELRLQQSKSAYRAGIEAARAAAREAAEEVDAEA